MQGHSSAELGKFNAMQAVKKSFAGFAWRANPACALLYAQLAMLQQRLAGPVQDLLPAACSEWTARQGQGCLEHFWAKWPTAQRPKDPKTQRQRASCSTAGLCANPLAAGSCSRRRGTKLASPSARKCSEDGGAAPFWHLNDARQSNAVAAQPAHVRAQSQDCVLLSWDGRKRAATLRLDLMLEDTTRPLAGARPAASHCAASPPSAGAS